MTNTANESALFRLHPQLLIAVREACTWDKTSTGLRRHSKLDSNGSQSAFFKLHPQLALEVREVVHT